MVSFSCGEVMGTDERQCLHSPSPASRGSHRRPAAPQVRPSAGWHRFAPGIQALLEPRRSVQCQARMVAIVALAEYRAHKKALRLR
ncbi:unnamed protein product [Arctogadus glacialis]